MASPTEDKENLKHQNSYGLLRPDMSELRLVLLGNIWRLKASVGDLLLGKTEFTEHEKCVKSSGTFQDKPLTVIYTPDQQLNNSKQDLKQFIQDIKDLSSPGPHVFLLVLEPETFTGQHKSRLQTVLESFSEEAFHHSLMLMCRPQAKTPGFSEKNMREPHIRDMIMRCRYRYLWMEHNDLYQNDLKELKRKELFSRICDMLKETREVYDPSEEEDADLTFSIRNKPSLNLVLFGRSRVIKTSVAESILGRAELPAASPEQCVKHQGEVSGRWVSLVELPALSEKPLETVMQLCLRCISLCAPEGIHAFILVLQGLLTDEDKEELEILQKTLSSRVRDFTVLISLESDTVNLEEQGQTCGRGALCLDLRDPQKVTEMMDTVDKLSQGGAKAYTKDMFLEALVEEAPKSPGMDLNPTGLRIALIGKNSSGKSSTANTILGDQCFHPKAIRTQANTRCELASRTVQGRNVSMVITPPLFDDSFSAKAVSECVSQLYPGPHAFLLLLPIQDIQKQDQHSLELIKKMLGEKVADYVIVVFTKGDLLKAQFTIENYITEYYESIKDILTQCKGRYHVLNNTNETNDTQVTELLKKIDKMAQKNSCFTQEMLKMKEVRNQLKEAQVKIQDMEDNTFWLKIVLFAFLFVFLAIYIKVIHNKSNFTVY